MYIENCDLKFINKICYAYYYLITTIYNTFLNKFIKLVLNKNIK